MTDLFLTDELKVIFKTVIRAHQTGGDVTAKVYADSIVKRLKRKLVIYRCDFGRVGYMDTRLNLLKGVTGKLHISTECYFYESKNESFQR